MGRGLVLVAGAALAVGAIMAHAEGGEAPGLPGAVSLCVGLVSRTFFFVPFWAAQRSGFFAQEGLRVEGPIRQHGAGGCRGAGGGPGLDRSWMTASIHRQDDPQGARSHSRARLWGLVFSGARRARRAGRGEGTG